MLYTIHVVYIYIYIYTYTSSILGRRAALLCVVVASFEGAAQHAAPLPLPPPARSIDRAPRGRS